MTFLGMFDAFIVFLNVGGFILFPVNVVITLNSKYVEIDETKKVEFKKKLNEKLLIVKNS